MQKQSLLPSWSNQRLWKKFEHSKHIFKLESEWKLKEAKMLSEIKLKEVEMQQQLEQERAKLQQLQADKEVAIATARVKAYNSLEGFENHNGEVDSKISSACYRRQIEPQLNPNATSFQPHQAIPEMTMTQESVSLAQAIASSLSMNRLPVPEPATFSGDPLQFTDWKMSFMNLIDRKPLPASEKMFYLKNYLAGEARKAVGGFFYQDSENAYKGAWKVLEDRYGNPFIIQKAFGDKLMRWPKISTNDPLALREFADFLKGCSEAIPHVKGLAILNDCEENHKLLKKLPEWIVRKWSRIVVDELDQSGTYPDLACFTDFLNREARIACNPIASPLLMNFKPVDDRIPKRAKVFNTNMQPKSSTQEKQDTNISKPKSPCSVCRNETHGISKCPIFAAKSVEDKKAFIHENRLCFGCLRKGHITKDCKRRHTCNICERRHPTCLHENRKQNPVEAVTNSSAPTEEPASQETHKVMSHTSTQRISATSSIVPVFVSSVQEPHREILTYALLDTQSDSTFVLDDILDKLNVDVQPVKLKLSTTTAIDTVISSKSVHGLQVRGLHSESCIQLQQAYSRDFIPVDKSYIPTKETALLWPHLRSLAEKLPPLQDCDVGLLIGYDCPSALAPLEVIIGDKHEPFTQRSELGWSIIGSSNPHLDRQGNQSFVHRLTVKELPVPSATDVLKALESDFAERTYENKYVSQEDVHFIQFLSNHITQREDGHYEMPLPFKGNSPPNLPNNKRLATVHLQCLRKKLKANKQYYDQYRTFMEETINRGDAEPAPTASQGQTEWYLPHHGIYHPRKPDKLRVVFDCSAKSHGVSLNDTLLTGPDLINPLVGVLCRFRKEAVAVICDIERMFYQFAVTPESRNYLKFLWWKEGDLEKEPQEYRMAVHLFGAASSPGCANFGLKHLARQHQADYPLASAFVEKNFYVDDGLASVSSVEEAKELITQSQELCRKGGLRLHKFNSNEEAALSNLDPSERAATIEPHGFDPSPSECALGIQWSIKDDTFSFNISLKDQSSTRRGCLSVIASLYDPLGFIAPFSLSGKHILQELCHRGIGWDDPLPEDVKPRWEKWINGLFKLKEVVARIKRLRSQQKHTEHATIEEREKAVEAVIKIVQQHAFPHEIKTLQAKRDLPNSSSLFSLDPIWSDGFLRVGGRLKWSSLCHKVKHPLILPSNSHITKLIVSHYHAKTCHQGRSQTQMELRANGFWVIGGSKLVAKMIHTCVLCRKLRRPTESQRMAELPKERLEASAPFTFSGMDCFGPFIVKTARKEHKRYGLIFTCLYSRAVHIEMLEDLSTDSFINALRCFISLRGAVQQLHCDQGSNFVGARNEFKEALKQCDTKQLETFLSEKQCEFVFNAPSASHAGGVWERQIRTVRNVLNATFAQCPGRLDDASLRTLLCEAMAIVNSRPLSVDGINDPHALELLTPNHLIMMKTKVALPPPGVFVKEDLYATKRRRRVQYLIEQFWGRWKREYLLNISTRQKWHLPRRNLKVNDIVVIKDDNLPRNHWQLGRVVETFQDHDGLVRPVKVQVGERKPQRKQDAPSKPSVIERPIHKLVLLLEN
ncbi:unnamed protein product [Oreochromis niloticus]|nr:unnamed protein product [Mustela putorius furo]